MSWQPPPRPTWVIDQIEAAAVVGPLALHRLEPDELIATAVAVAGSDDFGPPSWRVGFDQLCTSLRDEADLHAVGAALARSEILRTLVNRLRIVAASDPGGTIVEPWFVVGSARSGTSILHELLALDPARRAPLAWETLDSVPAPRPGDTETDPRVDRIDHEVRLWESICPEYLAMHENGARLPQECIFLTSHEFASEHWSGVHDVPSYNKWLQAADLIPAYSWHHRHLRWLQSALPTERWVLKAPSHLSALPALFAVYPDATVIQTHRDPFETIPSTISLMATLRWMRSSRVDVPRLARTMTKGVAVLFDWVDSMRQDGSLPDQQFVDVRYKDLVADPVETIRSIYDRCGVDFTDSHRFAITNYLDAKPKAKHGEHRYALEQFELDAAEIRERYGRYCERHQVQLGEGATT